MTERLSDEFAVRCRAVEENLKEIRERIALSALKAGRSEKEITLLAASKTVPAEIVNHAVACGVTMIGENRVQELLSKYDALNRENCQVHLIGHLQTNKIRQVVGKVGMIESVDSTHLAEEIGRLSVKQGLVTDVLLEVNVGREENKSGVLPEALDELLEKTAKIKGVRVRGLMAIPPICEKEQEIRTYFSAMYKLFIDIKSKKSDNIFMDFLSMGMSGDYPEAILEGANLVRVGSALFGARSYHK